MNEDKALPSRSFSSLMDGDLNPGWSACLLIGRGDFTCKSFELFSCLKSGLRWVIWSSSKFMLREYISSNRLLSDATISEANSLNCFMFGSSKNFLEEFISSWMSGSLHCSYKWVRPEALSVELMGAFDDWLCRSVSSWIKMCIELNSSYSWDLSSWFEAEEGLSIFLAR